MENTYRRRHRARRPERLLARLVLSQQLPHPAAPCVDVVHDADVDFRRA
jgi:hypothetical protein